MAGTTNYRYRPFGSFRLFLAFLVVLQHFIANAGPLGPICDYFLPYGTSSLAVSVFFCLSGFVIAEAATQVYPDKPAAYLANRSLRTVPHHIVALVTAVAILAAFNTWDTLRFPELGHPDMASLHAFDWSNVAANVLGFMPGVNRLLSFDFVDVIWAVRVEMVFYFLVFLVLLVPNRGQPRRAPSLMGRRQGAPPPACLGPCGTPASGRGATGRTTAPGPSTSGQPGRL